MKPRNPNDALFRLVKSMNSGEKRFFNLLCSRQGRSDGKIYIQIFQALDKLKENDEVLLKKKFRKDSLQFVAAKKYLYDLVLDSLVQYYKDGAEGNLHTKLLQVNVLLKKGLFDLCELLAKKLRAEAEEKNNFLIALETLGVERKLLMLRFKYTDVGYLKKIRKQENFLFELHNEIEDYRQLFNEIIYYDKENLKTRSKAFYAFAELKLFKDLYRPRSLMAKLLLHGLRSSYYSMLGDEKKSLGEHAQLIKCIESNSAFSKFYPIITSTIYMNCIDSCINLKQYNNAIPVLSKYKNFMSQFPDLMKQKLLALYTRELLIYKATNRINETTALIKEVNDTLAKEKNFAENQDVILFYLNAAFAYLDFKEYAASQRLVNKILNLPNAEQLSFQYYYNARILQLINLFYLEDEELLSYRVKSFQRFILKMGPLNKVDKVLIDFFHELSKLKKFRGKTDLSKMIGQLKDSIALAVKQSSENAVFLSQQDLLNWMESEILG